jgi:hypothetical protein
VLGCGGKPLIERLRAKTTSTKTPVLASPTQAKTASGVLPTVRLRIRKSLICASFLIRHLRPEMESAAMNFMPEVVSNLSYEFKKML